MKVFIVLLIFLMSGCATLRQPPLHTFDAYYFYDKDGVVVIKKNNEDHVCMPEEDYFLLYEAYNLYYGIDK
jgi:uncharacterized protein YcfL